jgi:hypothetical protein
MKQRHPDWSPSMIKSAFMTTASQLRNNSTAIAGGPFAIGAGHVAPNPATDPGLVYDSGYNDWIAFLCGSGQIGGCGTFGIDPSDLNYPSIAIGSLTGTQTVTRRVKNVSATAALYTASVQAPSGITVAVIPSSFSIAPGATQTFTATITRTTAALNTYSAGAITWSDGAGHVVRSPFVVRPVALAAPAEVSSNGSTITYPVTFGYTGPFAATPRGLVPATLSTDAVGDDPDDSFDPANPLGPGVTAVTVVIPPGTTHARFSLFDANVSPVSDLDLYVFRGSTLVGASGGATSAEEVNLLNPAADTYTAYVHGFAVPGTATFTLFSWALGPAGAGNMTVGAPASAVLGATGAINLTFSGLAPSTKYMGSVLYGGVAGLPNPTIVRVDTP